MPLSARPLLAIAPCLALAVALAACRGSPPRELGGFRLGASQERVLAEAGRHGDFSCRLRGTRPRLMVCEGPTREGHLRVVVEDDSAAHLSLRMDPSGPRPERAVHRFVRRFGEPVWRERPHVMPVDSVAAYHSLWLDRDTTRALALTCVGRRLEPPCVAELERTSPARIEAKLDTLLQIRR